MKPQSGLARKLSELTLHKQNLNRTIVQMKRSWDEIDKIVNTKECGGSKKK